MAQGESGKTRAQRIQLDYHRQRDGFQRLRRILVITALASTTAYAVYALLPAGAAQLSTGPLSRPHASIQDCTDCHGTSPFVGIGRDTWKPFRANSLQTMENQCRKCHAVDGHFRDRLLDPGKDQNCAACHREHLGLDHAIARVDNAACVDCHGKLQNAVVSRGNPSAVHVAIDGNDGGDGGDGGDRGRGNEAGGAGEHDQVERQALKSDIERFTLASHGDFRSLEKDPGRVRFDHAQHLRDGQVEPGVRGGFRLSYLDPAWQAIYRKSDQDSAEALVRLECGDCHVREGAVGAANYAFDEVRGARHAPVRFESHCAACHALNYGGRTSLDLPLPHAVPWNEMRRLLDAKLVGGQLRGEVRMPRDQIRQSPLPSMPDEARTQATPPSAAPAPANLSTKGDANAEIERGLALVRTRCLECHRDEDIAEPPKRAGSRPPLIPTHWLTYGAFHHAAHRDMECAFCHRVPASEDPQSPPRDQELAMIRGMESCIPCHRDATQPFPAELASDPDLGTQARWASVECIDCHRYHWTRPEVAGR